MTRGARIAIIFCSAIALGACNLVLGIDDVSSANGPDSGQRISSATAEPRDASVDERDPSRDGGGSASPDSGASPTGGSGGANTSTTRDRDAASSAASPDAAADEDAGDDGDDAGLPR